MADKSHYLRHYKDEHHDELSKAEHYQHLVEVAMNVLQSMDQPIAVVCGPLSSGGLGSMEKNAELFQAVMNKLMDQGRTIFNLSPIWPRLDHVRSNSKKRHPEETNIELLEEFYLPVYESGLISTMYFIPGWESSQGARWEREQANRLGVNIVDLPKDFLDKI